jgi:hypothetical protein
MPEAFSFELKLVDDVSRNAKKAADSLRAIETQAKKSQKSLDFSSEIEKAHDALKKLEKDPGGYTKLLKAQKELAEQRKKLASAAGVGKESFTEALGKKFNFGMLTSAAFAGDLLAEGAMKLGEGLIEAAHKVVEIFTEGITKAFEESGKEETRRLQFKLSLGTKEGKESLEDIERFSKLTGFTKSQIAPTILKLRRAGFNQQAARSIFATGTDIEAAGGMTAAEYGNFAEHLKLKGGVTTKQLVGAGINAPEFFKNLGKKLGVSTGTAEKMAGAGGKIDPQLMLNMFQEAVEKKQGGPAGTGGIAASNTFEKRIAKLKDLPNQYFEKLVDSPGFQKVSDAFGSLLEKLSPESKDGKRIMASLTSMFERIIGWFDSLTSEKGIDDLVSGVQTAVEILEKAVEFAGDMVDLFKKAAGVAETLAAPLAKAMDYGDKLLGRNKQADFSDAGSVDELRSKLKIGVASGVVKLGDVGSIVKSWKQNHINAPTVINIHGANEETGKKVGADVHRNMVNAHERAASEGG